MKKIISCLILTIVLMTVVFGNITFASSRIGIEPGEVIPDFTVSLTDGTTATLSDILKEKDLVVLNIFASWCGPCEKEFPDMENVYQANKDRMEILSVSGDPSDTMEMISDYKAGHELSFPMGLAGDALDFISINAFPTTIFIDKNGSTGMIKVGAFIKEGEFEEKVNTFLSPDYDGKPLATESAFNILPFILAWFVIGTVFLVVGRWRILCKAGRKGWHSLIPFLSAYEEYSTCWAGWIGLLVCLFEVCAFAVNIFKLPAAIYYILMAVQFVFGMKESLMLSKAFGKSTVFGVLMGLPLLRDILRFVLGVGKSRYQGLTYKEEPAEPVVSAGDKELQ